MFSQNPKSAAELDSDPDDSQESTSQLSGKSDVSSDGASSGLFRYEVYQLQSQLCQQYEEKKAKARLAAWSENLKLIAAENVLLESSKKKTPWSDFRFKKLDLSEDKAVKVAKIKDARGVTTDKATIITIGRVCPIPKCSAWVHVPRNIAISDDESKTTTSHIPYFGEDTFDKEKEFIEELEKEIGVDRESLEDGLDDEVFYDMVLALSLSAKNKETCRRTGRSSASVQKVQPTLPSRNKTAEDVGSLEMPADCVFRSISNAFDGVGSPSHLRSRFLKLVGDRITPNGAGAPEWIPRPSLSVDGSTHVSQRRAKTMDSYNRTFCRRCYQYNCQRHIESIEHIFPEYENKKGPFLVPKEPCQNSCFLTAESISSAANLQDWSVGDENMYAALAHAFPGNPCAIAQILQRGCRQVYEFAMKSEEKIASEILDLERASSPQPIKPSVSKAQGSKSKGPTKRHRLVRPISPMARYVPCFHPDSTCGQDNPECACKVSNTYCERFCNCDRSCKNRFQGCNCKTTCKNGICPCHAAGRECDPDLCISCGAGKREDEAVDGTCMNVPIQRGKHKHLVLAPSDIPNAGWGIFTTEAIAKGDFVYEYTGEVVSYKEADRRALAYDKRCHTFLFELNDHFMVDAMVKGNKMRFANHSDFPNCFVRVAMANGDHRIGVFAHHNIEAGEEITIYYRNVLNIHEEGRRRASTRSGKARKCRN